MPSEGAFRYPSAGSLASGNEAHRQGAQRDRRGLDGRAGNEMHPVVALAARQHGIVTTAQLLDAGVGRRSIARRVQAGWLVPLHRGVFQVGPTLGPWGREMAAVLACGDGAVLSHQSAGAVWGFAQRGSEIHVTAPARRRSRPGLRIHRTASLNAAVHNGLPLTTPAQTLRDLRRVLPSHELERAQEQAHILGLVIPDGDDRFPEFTRSEGERRLKALCKAAGLPAPADERARGGLGGRRVLAGAQTGRRGRRLQVPPHAPALRERPPQGRCATSSGLPGRADHVPQAAYEPLAVSAQLGALLSLRPA